MSFLVPVLPTQTVNSEYATLQEEFDGEVLRDLSIPQQCLLRIFFERALERGIELGFKEGVTSFQKQMRDLTLTNHFAEGTAT